MRNVSLGRSIRVAVSPGSHAYTSSYLIQNTSIICVSEGRSQSSTSLMLSPNWLEDNRKRFDIFHLHFSFRNIEIENIAKGLHKIRELNIPFVYTAHDLRDNFRANSKNYDALTDEIMGAANHIITLTDGAANEIEDRWGKTAAVIPHPHVVPFSHWVNRKWPNSETPETIGVHFKSGRESVHATMILSQIPFFVSSGYKVRIDINRDGIARLNSRESHFDTLMRKLSFNPNVKILIHDRFTDLELWEYFSQINIAILPYLWGTHSGWAEGCLDQGVRVAAPSSSHIPSQNQRIINYEPRSDVSLREAIEKLGSEPYLSSPWDIASRWTQRNSISRAHQEIYKRLLKK